MSVASSRTNGFLFSDLRDYTRYVESHGDQAAATLLDAYRTLVRSAVAEFGGAEIKTEGDSFYVVFPSASSAVQCGLAILDAAAQRSRAEGAPIHVGIGVHAGETVETAEGYVGSAVNVAARVCSQARAGELLVTDTVRALTRTFLPVRFVDRRARRLKGIAEPVVMYRVEPTAGATIVQRRLLPDSVSGVGRSVRVAVLLVGLLAGGAGAGYLLTAAQRPPTETPTPIASVSVTPVTAAETFPSLEEADFLVQIPAAVRDTCARTTNPAERIGALSLRCDLDLAADADTIWWDRFETSQELGTALLDLADRQRLPDAVCSPDVLRGQGNWRVGTTHSGRLLCYQDDGASWIIWSYQAERVMARAVRRGDSAADWLALHDWWKQIRLFLQ